MIISVVSYVAVAAVAYVLVGICNGKTSAACGIERKRVITRDGCFKRRVVTRSACSIYSIIRAVRCQRQA